VAFYAFILFRSHTKLNTIIYCLLNSAVSYYQPHTVYQIIVTLHAHGLVKIASHFLNEMTLPQSYKVCK